MKTVIIIFCFFPIFLYSQISGIDAKIWFTDCYDVDFENISKNEFKDKTMCKVASFQDSGIQKVNNSYTLLFENKSIELFDKYEEDNPSFVKYNYLNSIFDFLCFEINYYETSTTLLVNKKTGMFKEIFGNCYFSPDGRFLFCASQFVNYEPIPNNIQIYTITNGQMQLLVEYYIEDWIPDNIGWVSPVTIFFEQKYCDGKSKYAKITVDEYNTLQNSPPE